MLRTWLCLLALCVPMLAAAEVPLSVFTTKSGLSDMKISPNGDYVAAKVWIKAQTALVIIPLADLTKPVKILPPGLDSSVAEFYWAGPNRVIMEIAMRFGTLDQPELTGELYAVDADDKNELYLFGYRGRAATGSNIHGVQATYASAEVVRTLPDDPHHVIIAVDDWDTTADNASTHTYRLNVDNGLLDHPDTLSAPGIFSFLADRSGNLRYAVGFNPEHYMVTYARPSEKAEWKLINNSKDKGVKIIPLRISDDAEKAYLSSNEGGGRYCLVEQNISSGNKRTLSCDEVGDLHRVMWSFDHKEPIAAVYENDQPGVRLIDTKNPDRAKFAAVQKGFGSEMVELVSTTEDGSKGILHAYSDHNPGDYYLFDTQTMHASFLLSSLDNINPDLMADVRPVHFKARDGQMVHGYLTLPPGKGLKNLPLVVYPHGGPLDVADYWGWDAEAQMLASRGYAVLQVNYRGSSGYGEGFYAAGIRGWGGVMIDDITDATRWTVAQGVADPKRLCIYGGSYGGYAALMSAVKEPDLYRCAIGEAGVYDLNLLKNSWDQSSSRFDRTSFNEFVGDSEDKLRQASPLAHLDQLKAAVMIVHSVNDPVVPINQARALFSALDARHYPYESLIKADEGHGFYLPENREELYTRLLAFLDKNIGAGAANAAPAPVAAVPAASTPQADAGAAAAQKQ